MNPPFGTGAVESSYDSRTYRHDSTLAIPLTSGGVSYKPEDIEHQHNVGICTAISLVQNAQKALGKKFSPDFQYLLQKKFVDLNWYEGSSIFSALKVGKNFGFLPLEEFTYVTENDRFLPYSLYIAKLQAIPDAEIYRLIRLCTNKLAGYAQLGNDSQSLAKGILDSKAGILTRYEVGQEWWTPSWNTKDIDPIQPPQVVVSGHAITESLFDFTLNEKFELPNTWGILWNDLGRGHTIWSQYHCTEAWIPYFDSVPQPLPPQFIFTVDMKQGQTSNDITQLQKRLGVNPTGYYGPLTRAAVLKYQLDNNIPLSWYERYVLAGSICGAKTRTKLNSA